MKGALVRYETKRALEVMFMAPSTLSTADESAVIVLGQVSEKCLE